jgi:phosphatidylglycerol---prolipoprotein diacylglyceryl transferase
MFPKIFSWGDFFLPTYGVLVACGFLAALWIAAKLARRYGLSSEAVSSLGVNAAIAGLVGAKVMMILLDLPRYIAAPGEIFSLATLQSGGVFFGGLLAALFYAAWDIRRQNLAVLATLDAFGPGIALGHAIGRLGCFAAGCCWGVACDRPWAVTFTSPDAHDLVGVPLHIAIHPTQLYESIAQFIAFGILYRLGTRAHRPGRVMGAYLMLAGLSRFVIDFWRYHGDPNPWDGPLAAAQWISLALIVLGGVLWAWANPLEQVRVSPDQHQVEIRT